MLIFKNILIYSLAHALVDAACAAVVFYLFKINIIGQDSLAILIVLYNFLAFGLQAPLGFLVDKWHLPVQFAVGGCLVVALATVAVNFSPFLAVFLAGFGNALFHIGGGVISLNLEPKKAALPGIFVAPGALGLLIGILVGKDFSFVAWPFVFLLIIAAFLIFFIQGPKIKYEYSLKKTPNKINKTELIIVLFLLSITIRSIVGLAVAFPWKQDLDLLIVLTLAVFFGKAFGGIMADRLGWMRISMISLLISAPLLSIGAMFPVCGIVGFFLFNMTMPITLVAIFNLLPGRAGLAFGLTTFALLIGFILSITKVKDLFSEQGVIFIVIIISAGVLYQGLKFYNLRVGAFGHDTMG